MSPPDSPLANDLEVHDASVLQQARDLLEAAGSPRAMGAEVLAAVARNERWRGRECLNLLAPEAPTSPTVRALLGAEIGTRAAEGHIGRVNRWFAGTQHIDELEALCVELLKKVFGCRYADHRLCASMIGNLAVYQAMTRPGDRVMSASQPVGGHSSNRADGPAGVRGLEIHDVPFVEETLEVDLDAFAAAARRLRPKLVVMGMSMTLFPLPVAEMSAVIGAWGGRFVFDGAHQMGLIGGGQFQDPLAEGAAVMIGSAGKTFSGPQSGMMAWNDPELTEPLTTAVFPVLAATHQVNRVAALAYAAAEMLEYGRRYMAQIVANAQALGAALEAHGLRVLGAGRGYTRTHQVIADVRAFGGGLEVAHRLAEANLVVNKNLIPGDRPEDWDRPGGLRIATTEITRLGLMADDMATVAGFIARVLVAGEPPDRVRDDVRAFREPYQTVYYCFDNGLPPGVG